MVKFLDLEKQYQSIKNEVDDAIKKCIAKSQFIGGEPVKRFEADFASFLKVNHCIGVGNGTDALEIAIESLQLPPESEIIVPANSFVATSEAVTRSRHKVIFADIDPKTLSICPKSVKKLITKKTKALIVVHLYGNPAEMSKLKQIANQNSLYIIEDCAQAHGAEFNGVRVGSIGDIAAFSFYPGKNLGAYGDAGAIVTNNNELAEKCRLIANHGRYSKYDHLIEGRNSRLDSLQAAILTVKLPYLEDWINTRRILASEYLKQLSVIENEDFILPYNPTESKHVFHLFVLQINNREKLINELIKNDIPYGLHYPVSLPELKAYSHLDQSSNTPIANDISKKVLSLPIGEHLNKKDILFVSKKIIEILRN